MEVINYDDIRESFKRALEEECPDSAEAVLETVDDAVYNNSDDLEVEE